VYALRIVDHAALATSDPSMHGLQTASELVQQMALKQRFVFFASILQTCCCKSLGMS